MVPGPPTPALAVLQELISAVQPVLLVSSVPQTGMALADSHASDREAALRWKSAGLVDAFRVTPASSQSITLLGRNKDPDVKVAPFAADNSTDVGLPTTAPQASSFAWMGPVFWPSLPV